MFFFFKQKTAYEMRISDWSSDVCSSDLARNADPMCSFGDFVAVSDVVDVATAQILKREVSDGIIAPGFEEEAKLILAAKKGGKFIMLQAGETFRPPVSEYREAFGMAFAQRRNDVLFTPAHQIGRAQV